jgi:hypothetical protein
VGAPGASTLTVQHEIARVLHGLGQYEQSREHLVAVLSSRREQHGDGHFYTLAARHELARVLHLLGGLAVAPAGWKLLVARSGSVSDLSHIRGCYAISVTKSMQLTTTSS